ncbi:N-acyl homoserine lactonase family protein [Saccharopolyspora cebuensis]|uniref:N-acyl homoserine lactonase family protein n=1 Tax=Saccharopolyspora cebuensis TaxID=418759 RepID=A0ABV4C9P2_9PSEU
MAGQHEVTIVRCGTREVTRGEVFLNHHLYGEPDGPFTVDYFFWVVRGGERTILVDTGFDAAVAAARGRTALVDPVAALRELGIDPAGRHDVIVTHAHWDHIGNLPALSGSRILMSRNEYRFWNSAMARRPLFAHFAEESEIAHLAEARRAGRLEFVPSGYSPTPGVTVLEVGGHTPGQLVVLVDTAEGTVLLASDAVHFHEELERDMPFLAVSDLPGTYAGYDTVRELLGQRARHLVTGHDPTTLERFGALPELLGGNAARIG